MKNKVLLAEDDPNLGTILKEFLVVKGFDVDLCENGEIASAYFDKEKYSLCVLDIMMPQKDGFTLAKEIREKDSHVPIIFLTAKNMQEDKIEGLKIGADDYITKPFSTEELFLRINAILKRTSSQKSNAVNDLREFKIGEYFFYYDKRLLVSKDETKLTTKEAELLKLLCEHQNEILKRSDALLKIWKEDNYFTGRSMDVYITKLRGYLKNDPAIEISNIHGTGYKLIIN